MDLKTLEDYQKVARLWVEHVIPSDATFIKKLGCISTQSLNVFRDLLWLTRKEPLPPDFNDGYLACPVDLWRPVLNEYFLHDLWLYSVLRAVKILSFWMPNSDNAGSDLESSYQDDPWLYKIWPKMSDATTVFNGAGFSTAEAIINGLHKFILSTIECFCSRDRDMPDIFLVSENVMGYRNDEKYMEIWPNQHPAIKLWKDATLKEAKEYFPSAKWPLADLDREYSRVSILLDNEVTLSLGKWSERDSGGKAGDKKESEKQADMPKITEPTKEANQAYQAYYGTRCSQEKVAEIMTEQLHRKIEQWQVSRWIKQVKQWRSANGLPIDETGKKSTEVAFDPDVLDMGKRTDGRVRHRDPDQTQ
jgi:hypothetical protein